MCSGSVFSCRSPVSLSEISGLSYFLTTSARYQERPCGTRFQPRGGELVLVLCLGFMSSSSPLRRGGARAGWHLGVNVKVCLSQLASPFCCWRLPGPRVQPVVPDPMPILTTDGEEVYKQEAWCWKTFLHEPGPLCSEYLESDAGSIGI